MNCQYEGRRDPASRACEITRVDLTRLGALWRSRVSPEERALTVNVPFSVLYPEAVRFGWGDTSVDSWDTAWYILHDAFPDWELGGRMVTMFLNAVISELPEDGWIMDWASVMAWYADTQLPPEEVFTDFRAPWREV